METKDLSGYSGLSGYSLGNASALYINSSGTSNIVLYSLPVLIDTIVNEDSIEVVYKEEPLISYLVPRVFKIIFSCKNRKWHISERIYGDIIPAQEESYQFNQQ